MKKLLSVIFSLLLIPILSIAAMADAAVFNYDTWVAVSYYVYVTTPDGGLNLRSEPNSKSLLLDVIPDDEILHIVSVIDDSWGETSYNGSWGFVYLAQTTEIPPESDANYDVIVTSPDGGLNLRVGPGTGYDKIILIPDDEQLHITQISGDWGKTSYKDSEGWVYLDQTTRIPDVVSSSEPNAEVSSGALEARPESEQEDDADEGAEESAQEQNENTAQSKNIFTMRLLVIGLGVIVVALVTLVLILLINRRSTVKK